MSNSNEIRQRFAHRRLTRIICGAIFLVSSLIYLGWRMTIFNPSATLFSALFFAAEVMGVITGMSTLLLSSSYSHRRITIPPRDLQVDVFVTTFREPIEIIRRTMAAAIRIRYPHQTWLLDDGNRGELKRLALELGCRYLARNHNLHAKAGNLNNALSQSAADFFAVFDADHVPLPHALHYLLGFFDDPIVAFVQAPQDFYNTNSFQYMNARRSGALWHDQSFFYNISLPCADSWNAASCVGTSVVYRRSAIDEIGGIATETVTEDIHTSIRLHKAGFKSVYLNESIAYGVAAVDLREFYKTRLRWGHGNVHALRLEKVLTCKGLSLKQRFAYASLGVIYLEGWQHLIMYLVPILSLMTGVAPFEITLANVLVMIAYPLATYLLLQEFACGFGRYWVNELYSIIRFPIYILSSLAVFRDRLAWRSSSKKLRGRAEFRLMLPQIAVLALSLIALAVAGWNISNGVRLGPISELLLMQFKSSGTAQYHSPDLFKVERSGFNIDLLIVAGTWAAVNILRVALFFRKVIHDASSSTEDYFFSAPLLLSIAINGRKELAKVERISLREIQFNVSGQIFAPGTEFASYLTTPSGSVALGLRVTSADSRRYSAQICWPDLASKELVAGCLYSVDWHRELSRRHAYFLTPLEFLRDIFLARRSSTTKERWQPVLYGKEAASEQQNYGLLLKDSIRGDDSRFAAFEELAPGTLLKIGNKEAPGNSWGALALSIVAVSKRIPPGLDNVALIIYDSKVVNQTGIR